MVQWGEEGGGGGSYQPPSIKPYLEHERQREACAPMWEGLAHALGGQHESRVRLRGEEAPPRRMRVNSWTSTEANTKIVGKKNK